jgi:acyl-CoA dehydrogenase
MIRKKILETYKKVMPPISQTEKEALESGTVGFEGELFKGKPDFNKLRSLETPKLSKKEQAFLDGPVQELCDMIDNWKINHNGDDFGDLPDEIWDFMKKHKFFGMVVPEEYDGLGFSAYGHSQVVMKLSSRSITAGVTVMVPNSLGPAELIHEYGTQDQKDYYLPRLANGEEIPCFALTGPNAGSDAGGMPDTGVVCKNEKGELGIKINWDKRYITLGPVATLIGLAFKMEDPDGLLGDKKDIGITCALIPSDLEGIEIGDRHRPMNVPFQNGPNKGKDVFIPIDNIIGGKERAGQGWKMLMESLAIGRSISLPAQSVSGAKMATRLTSAYGRVRRQFNMPIGKFEGVEEVMARMAGTTYMMDAARTATVQMVDRGERPAIPSAIVKYHLTEKMRQTVNDAMDIHGGKSVSEGPGNLLAEAYKGIPIAITVEGANIMTRNLIIFGQGMVRSHPYMLKQIQAAEKGDEKALTRHLVGHIFNAILNTGRSLWLGLTNGRLSRTPTKDKNTKRYYQRINRLSAQFNLLANASAATLGGTLKRKERVTARLGDVLSNMYLASATLRHFESQGSHKEDIPLMKWAAEQSLHDAEKAMNDLLDNYPNRFVGAVLKVMTQPRRLLPFAGRYSNKAPSDKLDHEVAKLVSEPGPARDRLTGGIHIPVGKKEPLYILEDAFKKVVAAEPLEKKILTAVKDGKLESKDLNAAVKAKILTKKEAELIRDANAAREAVIAVDAFPSARNQKLREDRAAAKQAATASAKSTKGAKPKTAKAAVKKKAPKK